MFFNYLFLLTGFVLLIKGADWFVSNASGIAKKSGVSELTIGLTILAFGTSAPELVVNLFSSIQKENEMVMGNIMGSNIFNILVILGITSFIRPVSVGIKSIKREIPVSILAGIIILLLITDFFSLKSRPVMSSAESLLILIFFIAYTLYLVKTGKEDFKPEGIPGNEKKSTFTVLIFLMIGLVFLILGGRLVVNNAVSIAKDFGISEHIIGLTIIAIGTSLPELVTSLVAAIRGNSDLALGNVVGSNIFNLLFVLALSGLVYPIDFKDSYFVDILVYLFAGSLLMIFMYTGRRKTVDRWEGVLFFAIFVLYMIYILA